MRELSEWKLELMKQSSSLRIAALSVAVSLITGGAIGLGAMTPASASYAELRGAQCMGSSCVQNYNTARVSYKNPNAATMRWKSTSDNGGGILYLGLRMGGAQVSRAGGAMNSTVAFKRESNGSTMLPPGTFFINSRMEGFCGVDPGCGTVSWVADLNYDL